MMSYNATLSQDVEMVNTNDVLNSDNVNVGNDDEVNWSEKKFKMPKSKLRTPLMLEMVFFRVMNHEKMINTM
jgi:hypothetical protein